MPKRLAWLLVVAFLSACASPCEEARDQLVDCRPVIQREKGAQTYLARPIAIDGECTGSNECQAECVNDASCEAIAWVTVGTTDPNRSPPPGAFALSRCLDACR
jgi:hypothetical protein